MSGQSAQQSVRENFAPFVARKMPWCEFDQGEVLRLVERQLAEPLRIVLAIANYPPNLNVEAIREEVSAKHGGFQSWLVGMVDVVATKPIIHHAFVARANDVTVFADKPDSVAKSRWASRDSVASAQIANRHRRDTVQMADFSKRVLLIYIQRSQLAGGWHGWRRAASNRLPMCWRSDSVSHQPSLDSCAVDAKHRPNLSQWVVLNVNKSVQLFCAGNRCPGLDETANGRTNTDAIALHPSPDRASGGSVNTGDSVYRQSFKFIQITNCSLWGNIQRVVWTGCLAAANVHARPRAIRSGPRIHRWAQFVRLNGERGVTNGADAFDSRTILALAGTVAATARGRRSIGKRFSASGACQFYASAGFGSLSRHSLGLLCRLGGVAPGVVSATARHFSSLILPRIPHNRAVFGGVV